HVAPGDDGDPGRGRGHHRARPHALPTGDDGCRSARTQARDQRGDRALHRLHRIRDGGGRGEARPGPPPVSVGPLRGLPIVVFLLGFVLTVWLLARRVRGALLIGILGATVIAIVLNGTLAGWKGFTTPGAAQLPASLVQVPDFSTFGRLDFGVIARLGVVTFALATFAVMLSDFFDTMGTI